MRGNSSNYQRKASPTNGLIFAMPSSGCYTGGMRFVAFALLLVVVAGCEKQLSPEETEEKRQAEIAARPTPTPKPGAWMKDYKGPLDKKPTH
jgi:hypothetical protein